MLLEARSPIFFFLLLNYYLYLKYKNFDKLKNRNFKCFYKKKKKMEITLGKRSFHPCMIDDYAI